MSRGCDRYDDRLLDLVYGELDDAEAERVRDHAAGCAACREALESLLLTRRLAARMPEPELEGVDAEPLLAAARSAAAEWSTERETSSSGADLGAALAGFERRPTLGERLRAWLLKPALATAAAASVALVVGLAIFFGAGPSRDAAEVETAAPFYGPAADRKSVV